MREAWLHALEFQFCGAISPRLVTEVVLRGINSIGNALTNRFQLCGVFGVDLLIDDSHVWTIEIRPRLPSLGENIARTIDTNLLTAQRDACCKTALPQRVCAHPHIVYGKAILSPRLSLAIASPLQLGASAH